MLASTGAFAHTPLKASEPAVGAVLDAAPREIVLEFLHAVRLTALTLTSAGGGTIATASVPTEPAATFAVAVTEPMPAGAYRVVWRAVGADTHVISGTIDFDVRSQN
jgi:methionine-rich copper-binding protein CopC